MRARSSQHGEPGGLLPLGDGAGAADGRLPAQPPGGQHGDREADADVHRHQPAGPGDVLEGARHPDAGQHRTGQGDRERSPVRSPRQPGGRGVEQDEEDQAGRQEQRGEPVRAVRLRGRDVRVRDERDREHGEAGERERGRRGAVADGDSRVQHRERGDQRGEFAGGPVQALRATEGERAEHRHEPEGEQQVRQCGVGRPPGCARPCVTHPVDRMGTAARRRPPKV